MFRIQKLIAQAGICSRREAENLITQGRVKVNGVVVTELGSKADYSDNIQVDGKSIRNENKVYYVLNKPTGYVTTLQDPEGRDIVTDLIDCKERIFPIGRLDYNTSGILFLTNDGDLANKIMHPSHKVKKTYYVKLNRIISEADVKRIENGVELDGRKTLPAEVKLVSKENNKSRLEITITEGRNRQIRRMFESLNYTIMRLSRIAYGDFKIKNIPPGKYQQIDKNVLEAIINQK